MSNPGENPGAGQQKIDPDHKRTAFLNRDIACKLGGFGLCGRPICCRKWLSRPNSLKISIRMAKEQKIPLDPDNLNGFCQQIKCCVAFECDPEVTCIGRACQPPVAQRPRQGRPGPWKPRRDYHDQNQWKDER